MSSHKVLTLFYTNAALEPSAGILLMAGARPKKVRIWDTVFKPRPNHDMVVSGNKIPLWLVAQYALRCKWLSEQARQEAP